MVHLQPYTVDRYDAEQIARQAQQWADRTDLAAIMNAIPEVLLILNDRRQIVFANAHALGVVGVELPESIMGLRPGELLECEHAHSSPGGCGTHDACCQCGTFQAIGECQAGKAATGECRLLQAGTGRAFHFRVSTTPFELHGQMYMVLSLADMSHEYRRRNLERIFFHDLLNTVGAMTGYVQLLGDVAETEKEHISQSILRLADDLVEEIRAQRDLTLAENGELPVRKEPCRSRELLRELAATYRNHPAAAGRAIMLSEAIPDVVFRTDRRLLSRVIGNMIKNALEASAAGDPVLVGCTGDDTTLDIWVHNRSHMPREVQHQVFRRAFSTKGSGRGLGTYSMKLLTERYLKGEVSFSSGQETGTTFHVRLPLGPA